ncbi:PAS domain-containing protein [Mucilaginibacter pallidiroseus]|uniref:histidine kinase n=1 Tax=Mucilaginibacter pallidiroseus TaxID=2599295 RepID=A0A563UDA9_9SPHI|nr:ATP-binding protein [Mucilaginibacter pallidiroseus]TWR29259.1 PAS domain-containing protein [Mucilaginibacter pallidiroseus]
MPFNNHRLTDSVLLEILALSKDATAIYTSADLVIEMANDAMLSFWGRSRDIVGMPLTEAVPELNTQEFIGLLKTVWETMETYVAVDTPAELLINGKLQTAYFDFSYRAIKDADGNMLCILHTAQDVTERYLAKKLADEAKRVREELMFELQQTNRELTALNTVFLEKNDELNSTNEEVASLNEEYHSANEQLNNANNELSSLNEEYIAINEELNAINEELQSANNELADTRGKLQGLFTELKLSEQRLANIYEKAPIGIAVLTGPNHVIEQANDTIINIWGSRREDVLDKPHAIARPFVHNQGIGNWLDEVLVTKQSKINHEVMLQMPTLDGQTRTAIVNSTYQPIFDNDGNVSGILVILEDITETYIARKHTEWAQVQFRMAIDSAGMGTWSADPNSGRVTLSLRASEIMGLPKNEEITIAALLNMVDHDHRKIVADALDNGIKNSKPFDLEFPVNNPMSKERVWLRVTGKMFYVTPDYPASFSGILVDITEQKQDEIRKNDFIAMVSHELKTPLTSIKAYTQMLNSRLQKAGDEFSTNALRKTNLQIDKMNKMISGFLDISRLDSGKILLSKEEFDLNDLLYEVSGDVLLISPNHDIVFEPAAGRIIVNADRDKIGQVVTNLLNNAVKYADHSKSIFISTYQSEGKVTVSVKDEGRGIQPEDVQKLFERFYRVSNHKTSSVSGFGIGLYLSAEIISRHNGKIWVESEPDVGSTFYFEIPLT